MDEPTTLRQRLEEDFGIDLPISGGNGKSMGDAIIIDKATRDYVGIEYFIVKLIYEMIGKTWETQRQVLRSENNRNYDQLIVKVYNPDGSTHLTDFWFDITFHTHNTN